MSCLYRIWKWCDIELFSGRNLFTGKETNVHRIYYGSRNCNHFYSFVMWWRMRIMWHEVDLLVVHKFILTALLYSSCLWFYSRIFEDSSFFPLRLLCNRSLYSNRIIVTANCIAYICIAIVFLFRNYASTTKNDERLFNRLCCLLMAKSRYFF